MFNVGHDHTYVIVPRDTGEIVGLIGYRRPRWHAADMGYCMATRWWGHGLMTEAVGVILRDLQQDSQLYRVSATCYVDNARSVRVLEKVGLVLEGRLARYIVLPNRGPDPQDCLVYGRAMR